MVNGNRNRGYNIGMWNCRKGLTDGRGAASSKMDEIKQFILKKNLHILCVIEVDLHSRMSRVDRRNTVTRQEIDSILSIDGYKILLPASWKQHGQARMIVYVKNELQVNERDLATELTDLPLLNHCKLLLQRV